eukprot:m.119612 g.119612  ORF g.119612 m.119612 type:complete len:1736 (+) comp11028_c1_seq1:326-5533(+)
MNNGPESDSDYSALLTSPDESEDDQEDEFTEDTDEDLSEQDDDDEETDGDNDSGGPERELWDACGENNVDEVRRLIGSGIDVNRIDPARGSAPIHVAAELGCLDVIQVLVEEGGADRWLRDDEGSTALHAAAMNAEFAVAQFLIDSGASVDAVDQDEDTPLHVSVASSVSDQAGITICTALIAAGADIDARNESGWTPLHVAVENLQVWAVRLLINSGCNVNAVDRDGETPLHLVAGSEFDEGNAIAVLHLLLGAHPNIDLPKPDGHTALHIATLAQKAPLVRLLLQAGADPDLHTPPLNVSARELAVSHGHDDMLAIFEERLAWKSRQLPARQPSVLEADWPELPALAVRGPLLELTVDGDGSRTCYVHQAPSIDSPVVGSVKHGSHVHSYRSSMHRASDGSVWLKVAHWPLDGATHGDAPPPPSTDTGAGTSSSHNDGDGDGAMATQESSTTTTSSTSSSSAWICAADPQRRFPGLSWLMDGVSMLLGFKVMAPAAVLFSAPLCDHTTAQVLHGIRRFFRLGADKVILADVVGDVPDTCHGDASAADPNAIPGGLGNMLIAIARRSLSGLAGAPNGSEPPNCVLALEATELTVDSLPLLIREALNTYVIVTRCDHPDSLETLASVAMNMGDRLLLAISEHAGSNLTKLQMNRMGWEKKRRKGDAPASFNSVNGGAACGAGGASDGTTTLLEGGTAFDSVDDVSGGAATDRTATPTAAAVPAVSPLGAADASEVESATTTTVAAPAGADVDVNINTTVLVTAMVQHVNRESRAGDSAHDNGHTTTAGCTVNGSLLAALMDRVVAMTAAFKPQELSAVIGAATHLGVESDALAALLEQATSMVTRFDPSSLASVCHSTARHSMATPTRLLDAVGDAAVPRLVQGLSSFGEQECATLAWAFAKHNHHHPALFSAVCDVVTTGADAFTVQGLATVAWALSSVFESTTDEDSHGADAAAKMDSAMNAIRTTTMTLARANKLSPLNLFSLWHSLAVVGQCNDACASVMASAARHIMTSSHAATLTAQDAALALAAMAKDGHPVRQDLLRRIDLHVASLPLMSTGSSKAVSLSTLSSLLWGFAKCRHRPTTTHLVDAVASAIASHHHTHTLPCRARDVCNAMWSLAVLELEATRAFALLVKQLPHLADDMNAQDASNVVFALAKADWPTDTTLQMLVGAAVAARVKDMNPGALALAVWGLSKLGVRDKATRKALCRRVTRLLPQMHAQNVGMLCHAAASGKLLKGKDMTKTLLARAKATHDDMNWQSLGHVHLLMCLRPPPAKRSLALLKRLGRRTQHVVNQLHDECQRHFDKVSSAGLACAQHVHDNHGLAASDRVLLVGRDTERVRQRLKQHGHAVQRWERFASGQRQGRAWPKGGADDTGKTVSAALISVPAGMQWLEMELCAVASLLRPGAPVYCYGHHDDVFMMKRCRGGRRVASLFQTGPVHDTDVEDAFWICMTRTATSVGCTATASHNGSHDDSADDGGKEGEGRGGGSTLKSWRDKSTLDLSTTQRNEGKKTHSHQPIPWVTWPGLFAGGGLDIMTAFLLQHLPTLAPTSHVLDYCAGSGTIAKAIVQRTPSVRITLLDADAVAVRAAQRNVPEACAVIASDGWTNLPGDASFDLIVSNPPVHQGRCQDFGVVQGLLQGALPHLRKGGCVLFVTQSYIPAGLMGLRVKGGSVQLVASDGRFCVWRLDAAGHQPNSVHHRGTGTTAGDALRDKKRKRKRDEGDTTRTKRQHA